MIALSSVVLAAAVGLALALGARVPAALAVAPLGLWLFAPLLPAAAPAVTTLDGHAADALLANAAQLAAATGAPTQALWGITGAYAALVLGALVAVARSAGPRRAVAAAIFLGLSLLTASVAGAEVFLAQERTAALPILALALLGALPATVAISGGTRRTNAPEAAATAGLAFAVAVSALGRAGLGLAEARSADVVRQVDIYALGDATASAALALVSSGALIGLASVSAALMGLIALSALASREQPVRTALASGWLAIAVLAPRPLATFTLHQNVLALEALQQPNVTLALPVTAGLPAPLWAPTLTLPTSAPPLLNGTALAPDNQALRELPADAPLALRLDAARPWSDVAPLLAATPPKRQLIALTTGASVPLAVEDTTTRFAVELGPDGFLITDRTAPGALPLRCEPAPCAAEIAYPTRELSRALWRLKRMSPEERSITLTIAPELRWQTVVDAALALHAVAPEDQDGVSLPLFAEVALDAR